MSGVIGYRIEPPRQGLGPSETPAVWKLLIEADAEFIPPLSSRRSSIDMHLGGTDRDPDGPRAYFRELQDQWFLLARGPDGEVVGFMSYRRGHVLPFRESDRTSCYVSTVFVGEAFRRQGITRRMYAALIREADLLGQAVATRTWSTNTGHLRLLEHLGFVVGERRADDRGQGLDTLYLVRDSSAQVGATA